MSETTERVKGDTSARISWETAEMLAQNRRRLAAMTDREMSNDAVIQAMHRVFVQQPEAVIKQAVQP